MKNFFKDWNNKRKVKAAKKKKQKFAKKLKEAARIAQLYVDSESPLRKSELLQQMPGVKGRSLAFMDICRYIEFMNGRTITGKNDHEIVVNVLQYWLERSKEV